MNGTSASNKYFIWHCRFLIQEAFEKCWACHCEPFYIAIHQVSLLSHAATVARRLRIDVHNDDDDDDNDNAWQRGPLWPHRMGPITIYTLFICICRSTESRSNPDETRLREHLFDAEKQRDDLTTTPVENIRQRINVTVSAQILKLIALVNIKSFSSTAP